jgi:molybdopterin-guanine dinucleotide biosynthesis protein A
MAHSGPSREGGGVAGLILAGGRSRRMGGADKPFIELAGRPLIAHVIARAAPQVSRLVIGAAGDAARFAPFGLPVVADAAEAGLESFAGPLAGLLAGLDWAAAQPGIGRLALFPADLPFLPEDFVSRAMAALGDGEADWACAASDGRRHPVVALWPVGAAGRLRRLVVAGGLRRADCLAGHFRVATIDYAADPLDPFFNVNTPGDLAAAERLLR